MASFTNADEKARKKRRPSAANRRTCPAVRASAGLLGVDGEDAAPGRRVPVVEVVEPARRRVAEDGTAAATARGARRARQPERRLERGVGAPAPAPRRVDGCAVAAAERVAAEDGDGLLDGHALALEHGERAVDAEEAVREHGVGALRARRRGVPPAEGDAADARPPACATADLAARTTMSAHDTWPGHARSTAALTRPMVLTSRMPKFLSEPSSDVMFRRSSELSRMDPSHP